MPVDLERETERDDAAIVNYAGSLNFSMLLLPKAFKIRSVNCLERNMPWIRRSGA
jgi:hypothetical protein